MFDTGRPTEYEVGTHGSVPIDKKYDASCYEWRTFKMQQLLGYLNLGKIQLQMLN